MFFALLLVNVFVAKELHYIVEFSHGHEHHLVDRHSECTNSTHFHEYSFDSECHICDFNFSPKDQADIQLPLLGVQEFYANFIFPKCELSSNRSHSPPNLRGPPIHFT